MLFRFWVSVLFRHTKVDYVNEVGGFCTWSSDEEVIWFDVSVDEVLVVDGLHTGQLYAAGREGE